MHKSVFHLAVQAVALVTLTVVLAACAANTTETSSGSNHPTIGHIFPGPVQLYPVQLDGDNAETALARVTDASGKTLGFTAELQVVSRSGPFPILIVLDAERCVCEVRVLRYTARRGRGVLSKSFAAQFQGKCEEDPLQVAVDIDSVTGATSSSKAVAGGVRRAIELAATFGGT